MYVQVSGAPSTAVVWTLVTCAPVQVKVSERPVRLFVAVASFPAL